MSIVFPILIFGFLILIHELGHFITAKLSGVKVEEFSIFMGPAIWKKQVGETKYAIGCIPIGGYCAMSGEDEDVEDEPRSFQKAAWWKRLIILAAGVIMNFLMGLLLYALLVLPKDTVMVPQIESFEPCCTFNREDGLQVGDTILEIDGETVYIYSDVNLLLGLNPSGIHDFVVQRGGEEIRFQDMQMAHTHVNEAGEEYSHYGFTYAQEKQATLGMKLGYVWNSVMDDVRNVRLSLQMLFGGQAGLSSVTGPVGIVVQVSDVASQADSGIQMLQIYVAIGAFLSVNLAVMNLLPIPALDGGRIVALLLTTAIEKVTRKKIDPKYEGYIHGVGMILLLGLMAIIMFKDVWNLF